MNKLALKLHTYIWKTNILSNRAKYGQYLRHNPKEESCNYQSSANADLFTNLCCWRCWPRNERYHNRKRWWRFITCEMRLDGDMQKMRTYSINWVYVSIYEIILPAEWCKVTCVWNYLALGHNKLRRIVVTLGNQSWCEFIASMVLQAKKVFFFEKHTNTINKSALIFTHSKHSLSVAIFETECFIFFKRFKILTFNH